jgi:predicted RNA-binding Zn ribbon-like protein
MFLYVSGRLCLDFAGTMKHRDSTREDLLTHPRLLSDWAVGAGVSDAAIDVADDDFAAAIALREAIFRTAIARIEQRRPKPADVRLINGNAAQPQLTPRLRRTGALTREGSASQLLASLAADLLDLLAGADVEKVKRCADTDCTRLYIDSSRARNRQWCGMGICGNRAKVQAFRARQRADAT